MLPSSIDQPVRRAPHMALLRMAPDSSAPVDLAPRATPTRADPRKAEYEANKLRKRLRRQVGEAIGDYALIEERDRVMVCLSGGKDSFALLDVLEQDTYSVVKRVIGEGATMCSLCSRLRRGVLYRVAKELGATKIALGHHRDDILATFFLNLFFGGKLKTMPPKLASDDGAHVVIRPLAYVREHDLARYADLMQFPIIPCNLCGSQEHLQRKQVATMLREWEKKYPGRLDSIYSALAKVVPSHLMDRALFDFAGVRATGVASTGGDIAFDVDPDLERATEAAAGALSIAPFRAIESD